MTLGVQAPDETTPLDNPAWHVRLAVVWRDERLPVPIEERSRVAASSMGVRLSARPGSCIAHYVITSDSVKGAMAKALEFWATVVDEAMLPNWEIVSFSIDQIDEDAVSDWA